MWWCACVRARACVSTGAFAIESTLGVGFGDMQIKPVVSVSHDNIFDKSLKTNYGVDFDLIGLPKLKEEIGNVLLKLQNGVDDVANFRLELVGREMSLADTLGIKAPNFKYWFDMFFNLFKGLKGVTERALGRIRASMVVAEEFVSWSTAFSTEMREALLNMTTAHVSFGDVVVRLLHRIDPSLIEAIRERVGFNLENDKLDSTLPIVPSADISAVVEFIVVALDIATPEVLSDLSLSEPSMPGISVDGVGFMPPMPPAKPTTSRILTIFNGRGIPDLPDMTSITIPSIINTKTILDKLRGVRFPAIKTLLDFVSALSVSVEEKAGPFALRFSFNDNVLTIKLGVDWSLPESVSEKAAHFVNSALTDVTNNIPASLCEQKLGDTSYCKKLNFSDTEGVQIKLHASVVAGLQATLDLKPLFESRTVPSFRADIIHAAVKLGASLSGFDLPIVNDTTFYLALDDASIEVELGTSIANYTLFDTAATTTITATTNTPATVTTNIADCAYQFNSTCTDLCEKGPERTINITRHATGNGKPCPEQLPDCQPGEGRCPTTGNTTTNTTVQDDGLLAQAKDNFAGSFAVSLPFKMGKTSTKSGKLILSITNTDARDLSTTRFELQAKMSRGLAQNLRSKLGDIGDIGRKINNAGFLKENIPVLELSLHDLFKKLGGKDSGRSGWGDFLIWEDVLDAQVEVSEDNHNEFVCEVNNGAYKNRQNKTCEVDIFETAKAFKNHAIKLLQMPGLQIVAGTPGESGGKATFAAKIAASYKLSVDASWGKLFNDLPVKFRAAGSVDLELGVKGGFEISATVGPNKTVTPPVLKMDPFVVKLTVDADVELGVVFGIVEGTANGQLGMEMDYTRDWANNISAFQGKIEAGLEVEANLNGMPLSGVNGQKPRLDVELLDITAPKNYTVNFTGFGSLKEFIQLTPENVLLMLRGLDKFLQDYTNTTVFNTPIPMLDVTLKDMLDFTRGFEERISKKMRGPRPAKDRRQTNLALESGNFTFPFSASANATFKLVLDEEEAIFAPFPADREYTEGNKMDLLEDVNAALKDLKCEDRVVFKWKESNATNTTPAYTSLALSTVGTADKPSTLALLRLEYDVSDYTLINLAGDTSNMTLPQIDENDELVSQALFAMMLCFNDGDEQLVPDEPMFTTWAEFAAIVVDVLGEELGIKNLEVTFEKVDGRWQLLFCLKIPFGFTEPPSLGLDYSGGTEYVSAGIDADVSLELTPTDDWNYVKVDFGARFGVAETTLRITGRPDDAIKHEEKESNCNAAGRDNGDQDQCEKLGRDASWPLGKDCPISDCPCEWVDYLEMCNLKTWNMSKWKTPDNLTLILTLALDAPADATGPLEINKTVTLTFTRNEDFLDQLNSQVEEKLQAIDEIGYAESAFEGEGFAIVVESVRKLYVEFVGDTDNTLKRRFGIGLATASAKFFEPIFKDLEFKAKSSIIADVQSAHLTVGEGGVFDIRTTNGRGEVYIALDAKIINPIDGKQHEPVSLTELQTYLRVDNNSAADMLNASATISGGVSLTNVQVKLAGIPVDGWLEVRQEDVVIEFNPEYKNITVDRPPLEITSSLSEFNLKSFGLRDFLKLIEMAIEMFDGDDEEPGGVLSTVSDWELPFMDVTVGDSMEFIGCVFFVIQCCRCYALCFINTVQVQIYSPCPHPIPNTQYTYACIHRIAHYDLKCTHTNDLMV